MALGETVLGFYLAFNERMECIEQDKLDHIRDVEVMENASTYSTKSGWKPDMYITASWGMSEEEFDLFINDCLYNKD